MPIKVREGNSWKEVANDIAVPELVTGTYNHYATSTNFYAPSTKYVGVNYVNQTTKLLHVNATVGAYRGDDEEDGGILMSGANCRAWISDEVSKLDEDDSYTNPNPNAIEVANIRDNGTWATEFLFFNPQFFVPVGYWYRIQVYSDWTQSIFHPRSWRRVFTWSELSFELE